MDNSDFEQRLLSILTEFHEWQLDHADVRTGQPPYSYSTLGLAEWLEFERVMTNNNSLEEK